jgi:uncharacterized membrane protein YphA (DoxX/SURF4 family)
MHPFLTLLVRLVLGIMWLVAAAGKFGLRASRAEAVAGLGFLPLPAAAAVGAALPWVELALGGLLLVGKWTTAAAWVSAGLLFLFSGAIVINLARGREVECNCFGQFGGGRMSWRSVGRNLCLLGAALMTALSHSGYLSLDGLQTGTAWSATDPPALDFLPVLLMGVAAALACALLGSTWQMARAITQSDAGPAFGAPERAYLRRWMRLPADETVMRNGG